MSFLAPLAPYLMAAGTAVSGISQMQNASYQAAVATRNATILEETAKRETFAANQDIAENDAGARAQIAELMAQMNASGIDANSGSLMQRRAGLEQAAARDRERLQLKRDNQLEGTLTQAAGQRGEASAAKSAKGIGLLTTLLNVPTSFLSGSSMVNEYNKGRLTLSNPSYMGR